VGGRPRSSGYATTIGGVDTVCTGIGEEAQKDPRWLAYPVRIEFSNGGAQYLSGAHVELTTASGASHSRPRLSGILGSLPAFARRLQSDGNADVATRRGHFERHLLASRSGQKRVVLDFSIKPNQ